MERNEEQPREEGWTRPDPKPVKSREIKGGPV